MTKKVRQGDEEEIPPPEIPWTKEQIENYHPQMTVRWDTKYKVLVDELGIMLTKADAEYLFMKAYQHVKDHTALEREAIGRRTLDRRGPDFHLGFNPDYFKEDDDGVDGNGG